MHAASVLLTTMLASFSVGCMTRTATPDLNEIEIGLKYAARNAPAPTATPFYTSADPQPGDSHSLARPTVVLVVPRDAAEAAPLNLCGSNLFAGRALSIEINPTRVVVKSMSAYLDDHASVTIVPEMNDVPDGADLVLEPVVESLEWRTNMWSYAYFAARIEAKLDLTLRDHTNGDSQSMRSGWVAGGTYWTTTPTGVANRVVRAVAHATAIILDDAGLLARITPR